MKTGVTPDDLVAAGYVYYAQSGAGHKHADCLYSKTIRSGKLKLYFIHVFYYDHRLREHDSGFEFPHGYVVESSFFLEDGTYFSVQHNSLNEVGIAEMQRFFSEVFEVLHCVPDVHNND